MMQRAMKDTMVATTQTIEVTLAMSSMQAEKEPRQSQDKRGPRRSRRINCRSTVTMVSCISRTEALLHRQASRVRLLHQARWSKRRREGGDRRRWETRRLHGKTLLQLRRRRNNFTLLLQRRQVCNRTSCRSTVTLPSPLRFRTSGRLTVRADLSKHITPMKTLPCRTLSRPCHTMAISITIPILRSLSKLIPNLPRPHPPFPLRIRGPQLPEAGTLTRDSCGALNSRRKSLMPSTSTIARSRDVLCHASNPSALVLLRLLLSNPIIRRSMSCPNVKGQGNSMSRLGNETKNVRGSEWVRTGNLSVEKAEGGVVPSRNGACKTDCSRIRAISTFH